MSTLSLAQNSSARSNCDHEPCYQQRLLICIRSHFLKDYNMWLATSRFLQVFDIRTCGNRICWPQGHAPAYSTAFRHIRSAIFAKLSDRKKSRASTRGGGPPGTRRVQKCSDVSNGALILHELECWFREAFRAYHSDSQPRYVSERRCSCTPRLHACTQLQTKL